MKKLSFLLLLTTVIFTLKSNAQVLNGFVMDWSFTNANGTTIANNTDVCCGGSVFLINRSQFNIGGNANNALSIGNQLNAGTYTVYFKNANTTTQGLNTVLATINADDWPAGGVIEVQVSPCHIAGGNTLNFWVGYNNPSSGSNYVTPAYSGALDKGYYLRMHNVNVTATADDPTVCLGNSTNLVAQGAQNYLWDPSVFLNNPTISNPVFTPVTTGQFTYTVEGTSTINTPQNSFFNQLTCSDDASVTVNVVNGIDVVREDIALCGYQDLPYNLNGYTPGAVSYEWSQVDQNGTSTVVHTGQYFTIYQPGEYCLTVTNSNGCTDTDCFFVNLFPVDADIQANATTLCGNNPAPITLTALPQPTFPNNIYTYLWSTGETTPTIDVTQPGSYTVTVTNPFGCFDDATITIDQLNFDVFDVSYCFDDCHFTFTPNVNAPQSTSLSYFWDFGNGITSTMMSPSIHFQNHGVNNITLTVTANTGNQSCDYIYDFSVFNNCPDEKCKADANFNVTLVQPALYYGPRRYQFDDLSSAGAGTIVSYEWTVTKNGAPYANYNTPDLDVVLNSGNYEFCLKITVVTPTGVQCIDTHCEQISIPRQPLSPGGVIIKGMKVSPNPSSGKFMIVLDERVDASQKVQIEVYNTQGKNIYTKTEAGGKQFQIDLTGQPAGIYQLIVRYGSTKLSGKIILQK